MMMVDFLILTLILVFSIPLLVVLLTLISPAERQPWLCLGGIGLILAGLIVIVSGGTVDLETGWVFMGEPITFSITPTAIGLYAATLVVLVSQIMRPTPAGDSAMTAYQWSLLNLALSFGFIAFISGQFMIRYIALDMVGLLAALTVLSTFSATSGLNHFIIIFQILRLGDLSLLASILLINHIAGTLEISNMITAAVDLPPNLRTWVFLGFFLALLIKMAIWPFGIWLKRAHQSAPRRSFWISGLLLPVLGFYLLYRLISIFQSAAVFQYLTLYSALALALLTILFTALGQVKYDRYTMVSSVTSCFVLAGVAFGDGQWLLYYLVGVILHRWLLLLDEQTQSVWFNIISGLFLVLINSLFMIFNQSLFSTVILIGWTWMTVITVIWDQLMQRKLVVEQILPIDQAEKLLDDGQFGGFIVSAAGWLNRTLELGVLTHGLARMSEFFHRIAVWVYHNVEMGIEALWIWIGRKLVQISEGTLRKVEVNSANSTRQLLNEALQSLEQYEQKIKRKALRWDLAWIPFFLVVILIMLFVM
jgi:hypothetical protein